MKGLFGLASGSVGGRSHRLAGKSNQDACCCLCGEKWAVAVVCDGCSSGEHNEVGAQIGARLIVQAVAQAIAQATLRELRQKEIEEQVEATLRDSLEALLEQVRRSTLSHLLLLARDMGESLSWTINHYFLFTVVGALLTPAGAAFFSLGDGVLVVNDEVIVLGPFPGNAPPYLAYGLLQSGPATGSSLLRLQINRILPLEELQSFLIGTDGVQDLMQAAERPLPGKTESVGPLSQFWQDERYFANPDMVRRRLAGIARDVVTCADGGIRKEAGLLADDTTLIVGRRRKMADAGGGAR